MTDEPWHGYSTCPVCGSTEIEDYPEDGLIVVFCNGCGQTLHDTYDPEALDG